MGRADVVSTNDERSNDPRATADSASSVIPKESDLDYPIRTFRENVKGKASCLKTFFYSEKVLEHIYMYISRDIGRTCRISRSQQDRLERSYISNDLGLVSTKNRYRKCFECIAREMTQIFSIYIYIFEVVLLKATCSQMRCIAARKPYRTRGYIIVSP